MSVFILPFCRGTDSYANAFAGGSRLKVRSESVWFVRTITVVAFLPWKGDEN